MNSLFAVFGNPIKHSKSPRIYEMFSRIINISKSYDLRLVSVQDFDNVLNNFFKIGGLGANITTPFKKKAFFLCNFFTKQAAISQSVNTIKKQLDGTLLGDNTDGKGLLYDLNRLGWIKKDEIVSFKNDEYKKERLISNILLIGAGGAASGIIFSLLNLKRSHITVVNRTFSRAQKLVNFCHSIDKYNISCISLPELYYNALKYDLIINATTISMNQSKIEFPSFLIDNNVCCYDLFYQNKDTEFIKWCKFHGAVRCSDGLGMLVAQAAYSFSLWHGIFPSIVPVVLESLRYEIKNF